MKHIQSRLAANNPVIRRIFAVNSSGIRRIQHFGSMPKYIYEHPGWPNFTWDDKAISALFGEVRRLQGKLMGQMGTLGFADQKEASLVALTEDVVKSSEIEGELLNYGQVRSSLARRLGINTGGLVPSSRHVEGVVEMMLDATQHFTEPLTTRRLFGWHAALFPTGHSGPYSIEVGRYRSGEMQVVSGAMGKEKVHYQAVPAGQLKLEMARFIEWFNTNNELDGVLKAAIAHFRFIIVHPFDDGNGRIARALSDMLLARSEGSSERFYSMSGQILAERRQYYAVLQQVQYSTGDITPWLVWFLGCLKGALLSAEGTTGSVLRKVEFWRLNADTLVNERQRLMLNKLLDRFEGKLTTSKWAKMTKVSTDTALRDIHDMVAKGILRQAGEGGRSTNYVLA